MKANETGVDRPVEQEIKGEDVEYAATPDDCHWCGANPATRVLLVQEQTSEHSTLRMLRVDHLCEDCATAFWTAIHNAQKERMF